MSKRIHIVLSDEAYSKLNDKCTRMHSDMSAEINRLILDDARGPIIPLEAAIRVIKESIK